jgi:hypothetical protein
MRLLRLAREDKSKVKTQKSKGKSNRTAGFALILLRFDLSFMATRQHFVFWHRSSCPGHLLLPFDF